MPHYSGRVGGEVSGGLRLDRYAAERLKLLNRSQIKARILEIRINGKEGKLSHLVKPGDDLELLWSDPPSSDLIPEDIPLDILYEDDRVVVLNKAPGMVVHPGAGNASGTLANGLLYRRLSRGGSGEGFRPGIVHRLDKDTSGVMIAAYDDEALAFLADQFKSRRVKKSYRAIVRGVFTENTGTLETRIARDRRDRKRFTVSEAGGKPALTRYRVIRSWFNYSLVLLRPKTGRTHQLRVHMSYLGHPILGDPLYGGKDGLFPQAGLMLHAKSLALYLPGKEGYRIFKTPLPPRFFEVLKKLKGKG
ncbi:RluA family pseudouridine synthase [Treponema sp. TIM-1]|uniref:RluA family pseudouridine synthase n=1 Tax=Treponema sp. TIM-1 TaxID=2898417 RepID=UPI00397EFCE1